MKNERENFKKIYKTKKRARSFKLYSTQLTGLTIFLGYASWRFRIPTAKSIETTSSAISFHNKMNIEDVEFGALRLFDIDYVWI